MCSNSNSNSNSNLGPVIYIAESPEQAINYKWDSRAKALEKNPVTVMDADAISRLGENGSSISFPHALSPGEVLVQHPYKQGYILATDAEKEYLNASIEGMFLIARCLGAKRITYTGLSSTEYIREINSYNSMHYKVVCPDVNVDESEIKKELHKMIMDREFPQQEFTKEQFNKAKLIAEERGLLMSDSIRSLLDARNPDLGAPMIHEKITVEVLSSLNRVLDIAFTLNTVPFFDISLNMKKAIEKKIELKIDWDISF